MNGAVKMKCTGSVERADHMLIITIEVYIHCWRTILFTGFSVAAAIPHTILNNVNHSNIINECQIISFWLRRLFDSFNNRGDTLSDQPAYKSLLPAHERSHHSS